MNLTFKMTENALQSHAPPAWSVDVNLDIAVPDHETFPSNSKLDIEAISIEGRFGELEGLLIWPIHWQPVHATIVPKGGHARVTVRLPMTREMLEAIEARRRGPLRVVLQVAAKVREIRRAGPAVGAETTSAEAQVFSGGMIQWVIDRDTWLEKIARLGWLETEVFELVTGPMGEGVGSVKRWSN